MNSAILYIVIGLFSTQSIGSIYHWRFKIGIDSPFKSIGEDNYKFKEGDWNCTVLEINKKLPPGNEIRTISCEGLGGLSFGINLGCGNPLPDFATVNFSLTSNKKLKYLTLSCGK
jgi:hypothetical protein